MGKFSEYDVLNGMGFVFWVFFLVALLLLIPISFQLYGCLKAQDTSLTDNSRPDVQSQILDIIKRVILWVIGYKGENREKTPVAEVDLQWVAKNKSSIIFRLLPIYAFYILCLVVLTRPVFLINGDYQVFEYSSNLQELFAMLIVYVFSNIIFDYFSIRYTLSHVMQAKTSKRYIFFFLKDILVASILFLVSQAVSCVLWVLKREDPNFPELGNSLFNQYLEITLWPYAFVTGEGSTEIVSQLFPGQLFITGTVFFPTVMLGSMFLVFSLFLSITHHIKVFLTSRQLDKICRMFLKVHIVGMFTAPKDTTTYRYCNLAFLAVLNIAFITTISVTASKAFT